MMSRNNRYAWGTRAAQFGLIAAGLSILLLLDGCRTATQNAQPSGAEAGRDAAHQRMWIESGSVPSATGCTLTYDLYRATDASAPVRVVLAHGFLRSKERMAGLAAALANAGVTTLAVDLCNMRFWNGAHRQNAEDMQKIVTELGMDEVLYAGFSAGGLAALLAARADPRSVGALVLDLVDQDGRGADAAAALERPIIGLIGASSRCNADNNGLAVFAAAADAEMIAFDGASHCDFESPTDRVCRLICEAGVGDARWSAQTRARIIDASVQAARRLLGRSTEARPPPQPGE